MRRAHPAASEAEPEVHEHVRNFQAFHDLTGPIPPPTPVRDRLRAEVESLLRAHAAGDPLAATPLRPALPALRHATDDEVLAHPLTEAEARSAIAGLYWFGDWDAVEATDAIIDPTFERAADAVVQGRVADLERLLTEHPDLVHARSPFGHHSLLLHYVSANGVESRRQRTPSRVVDVTRLLLDAGAEVDGLTGSYGAGPHGTTLCLTVSSGHPAEAGLQGAIVDALLEGGAAIEGITDDGMPLTTALAFGYQETAELLVERGARIRNLVVAAGLGRTDRVEALLGSDRESELEPYMDPFSRPVEERQALLDRALLQVARTGRSGIAELLLDAGADANATYENGRTPMHWVAYRGDRAFLEALFAAGGDPTIADSYYGSPPAVWAREGGHPEVADWLAAEAANR